MQYQCVRLKSFIQPVIKSLYMYTIIYTLSEYFFQIHNEARSGKMPKLKEFQIKSEIIAIAYILLGRQWKHI